MIINSTPSNVTWFSSAQSSMPTINSMDENGIIKILDACLINGGIERSVLSVTIDGNKVTLDFGSGHGFNLYQIIYISGADDVLINGNHKVIDMTNNTATIEVVGALVDTGVIKAKIAPLGYESIFGMTNPLKRAYRSLAASSAKRVIYLDMSYPDGAGYHATAPARRAMIDVCEDMQTLGVEINSYTSAINNKPTNKNGALFWYQARGATKSTGIDSFTVPWMVVGNGDFFYLCIGFSSYSSFKSSGMKETYGFGEYIALDKTVDSTFLIAPNSNDDSVTSYYSEFGSNFGMLSSNYIFSSVDGAFNKSIISFAADIGGYSGITGGSYPSPSGNFLFTLPLKVLDTTKSIIGFMPAYLFIEHQMLGNNDGQVIDGCLISRTQRSNTNSPSPANVGFYVGI
ncbi:MULTISPECIES: hypothetical protein [unclassified Psychrobacter]|uniref:hypothetical protein n=1 Tax=unclassified Psychrobacter TaxID=196806 RepID=UPI0025E5CDAE|nr:MULTISPECIES: hypothetical protein [unclassified Psychrobacter]